MTTPIYVDFLDPGDTGVAGRIGMTIAPGKKADAWWDRDLDTDLKRLREEYFCDVLVSLMEDDEYRGLQIEDLFDRAPTQGIAVLRFPIRDAHLPRVGEMPQFHELIGRILEAARAGQTVVIHCRGGLGRKVSPCRVGWRGGDGSRCRQCLPGGRRRHASIDGFGDALWWSVFTTSVGSGDIAPVTPEGRFIAVALMLTGIGWSAS